MFALLDGSELDLLGRPAKKGSGLDPWPFLTNNGPARLEIADGLLLLTDGKYAGAIIHTLYVHSMGDYSRLDLDAPDQNRKFFLEGVYADTNLHYKNRKPIISVSCYPPHLRRGIVLNYVMGGALCTKWRWGQKKFVQFTPYCEPMDLPTRSCFRDTGEWQGRAAARFMAGS